MAPKIDELKQSTVCLANGPTPYVAYMGEIGLAHEVLVPVSTHGLNYGTSLFEGVRAFRQPDGRLAVWLLEQHLDRFEHSLRVSRMSMPVPRSVMRQSILDAVALNDDFISPSMYIRPLAWRGEGLGIDVSQVANHFAVIIRPWGQYLAQSHNDGAKVLVSSRARPTADMVDGTGKLAGFYDLWSVPEKSLAKEYSCDEAVFAPDGWLQDGTGQEIMVWTKDGERLVLARTAGAGGSNLLHSTTRDFLTTGLTAKHIQLFPYREARQIAIPRDDIVGMALVGTASGVVPVTCLAFPRSGERACREVPIGGGFGFPGVTALAKFYQQAVSGKLPEYSDLLTPVPSGADVITRLHSSNQITEEAMTRWKVDDLRRNQQTLCLS